MLLAALMLASIGGRYPWPVLPALIAAAGLFLFSGARVGADTATRALDVVILASLGLIGLQLVSLPPAILGVVSPATPRLQDAYTLASLGTWRPISIHPSATRDGFSLAVTAAMVFWAAREAFAQGGSRAGARLLSWIGAACAVISLAQHATAPKTLLWNWTVADPRAVPFGPFVDRNQLATWLVLVISVAVGYLAMHVRAHMRRPGEETHAALVVLGDGAALGVLVCVGAMLLTLVTTLSRSGLIALVTAAFVGTSLYRRNHRHGLWMSVAAAAILIAIAAWVNVEGLSERVISSVSTSPPDVIGRFAIWRDTLRVVRAFPLFGSGIGTFADAMFVDQQTARQVLFNHAHNEYLQIAAEGGALMLATVLTGLFLLTRAMRVRLAADDGSHRFVRIGASAGLVAIAVQSVWETGLRAPANLLLVAILAGMAIANRGDSPSETTTA